MTDSSPTPPKRQDPQLDPDDDADEPAFDWMKPSSADKRPAPASHQAPGPDAAGAPEPLSRADRKAAEAAVEPAPKGTGAHFSEPLPTSALQIRPPEEEVQRRNAEREHAANAKPVAPRVMQVLLAVCFPVILLVLAVRAVASPLFLWVEYNRPG
ncbi:MAG TPA: TIGR01906 family membrane protein, partial [Arthrobacter sp.]